MNKTRFDYALQRLCDGDQHAKGWTHRKYILIHPDGTITWTDGTSLGATE